MKAKLKRLRIAPVKPLTFEVALAALRRGKRIRRRAWHPESLIFRLGDDVFVKLPNSYQRAPDAWKPYPQDVLANDWMVVR